MRLRLSPSLGPLASFALAISCSEPGPPTTGSGGASATGGTSGTAGGVSGGTTGGAGTTNAAGSAGASGKGGSGGAAGSGAAGGGAAASGGGGTPSAGGAGTGGSTAGSGGGAGISAGASGAGGSAGDGGASGASGAAGNAGSGGGTAGTGATRSDGCGNPPPPATDDRQTLDVDGEAREYIVNYPTNYDPNHAYRVLYIHHGRGGNAEQNITRNGGWYGVGPLSEGTVIFVSPHGDGDGNTTGWPNSGGRDVAFLRALVTHINATFCVDETRIFTTGMSYGGNFSNVLGCEMGDVFRAIAPFAGWGPTGGPGGGGGGGAECIGKPAAIVTHGTADDVVTFDSGEASRDHWLQANGCTSTSMPIEPSPCVVYDGCDEGYPVAWCEHDGAHILPEFSGPVIWNFISQF